MEQTTRKGFFLPLRLITYVILTVVATVWVRFPETLQLPFVAYSLLTLAFALLLWLDRIGRYRETCATLIGLQFLAEIVVTVGVISSAPFPSASFSGVFILTIASAALIYRLIGTLLVATAVSVSFATPILVKALSGGGLGEAGGAMIPIHDELFYPLFLHILIFYLVAFIAGYLAERLQRQREELADASQALRDVRLETDEILKQLNSGLMTVDTDWRIVYFNRSAERILGFSESEVRGRSCAGLLGERMPELEVVLRDGLIHGLAHPRKEIVVRGANGLDLPLGVSTSVLTGAQESVRGVVAIFSDLTEAKLMESRIRVADRLAAVGELSASIAHEIRNPLAAISGSVEVLRDELALEGENARLMDLIIKESHRLNNVLKDFLLFARIERPRYRRVELCHLVSDAIHLLYHHEQFGRKMTITFDSPDATSYVGGDEDMIKQLILNVALNACESYEGKPGRIHITLRQGTNAVVLTLTDFGSGMTPDQIRRIYQPFYSTKKHGTGLGLAIVHRIAQALKLSIQVESEPGKGTTFAVEFPPYGTRPSDLESDALLLEEITVP